MMSEKIKGAIVIHGPGRSGTTLFNNILSLHPQLSWISGYVNRFPQWPALAFLNRLQTVPVFERTTRGRRYLPRPAEAYDYWDYHLKYVRNYNEGSLEKMNSDKLVRSLRSLMRYQGKTRLVIKLTGLARGKLLKELFQDPVILYLDRDPRDVIVSYFRQRWLHKKDPEFERLDRRELLREYVELFKSFQETKNELAEFNFTQLKYEDLVASPLDFFMGTIERTGLSHHRRFYELVKGWKVEKNAIGKWKEFLRPEEIGFVNELLAVPLISLGYR